MRTAYQLLLFLGTLTMMVTSSGGVRAETATEDFLPATLRLVAPEYGGVMATTLVPDNPAAVFWGSSDRVAAGSFTHEANNNLGLLGRPLFMKGHYAGAGLIWDRVALGMDWIDLSDNQLYLQQKQNRRAFRIGFKVAEKINFGVSTITRREFLRNEDPANFQDWETRSVEDLLGFSVNLLEWFHLGYAAGKEEVRQKNRLPNTPFPDLLLERNIFQLGAAIRTKGLHRIYLEAGMVKKADFGMGLGQGMTLVHGATQVILWDHFLVGGGSSVLRDTNPQVLRVATMNSDMGWIAAEGYSLTARYSRTDSETDVLVPNPVVRNQVNSTHSITLSWLF